MAGQPLGAYGLDSRPARPLHYGLIVDEGPLQQWHVEVLRWLDVSGVAVPTVVFVDPEAAPAGPRWAVEPLTRFLGAYSLQSSRADPGTLLSGVTEIRAAGAEAIDRAGRLDFVLCLGTEPVRELLEQPAHGVWAFRFGETAPRPLSRVHSGILTGGEPTLTISLRRVTTRQDPGVTLKVGRFKVDGWSPGTTLDRALRGSSSFPALAARDLLNGVAIATGAVLPPCLEGLPGRSGTLGQVQLARLGRLHTRAFTTNRWSIAVGRLTSTGLPPPPESLAWEALPNPGGYLADPFLVPGSNGRVLLCERLDHRTGRGVIERVERHPDGLSTTPLIDDAAHHLSYPFLFKDGDRLYCLPERASSGRLVAFHLSDDATTVLEETVLMSDIAAVDPTLVRHNDRWWLFCTLASEGLQSHLFVFHASRLGGPWIAHTGNPVVVDVAAARPAGQPFYLDGALIRPGQDGSRRYGGGVGLYRVEALSPTEYRERRIHTLAPAAGTPAADGLHHISFDDEWVAIDGYVARSSPRSIMDKTLGKLATRRRRSFVSPAVEA